MTCPDCGQKLEEGYLHSWGMIWTKQIRHILFVPGENGIYIQKRTRLCCSRSYLCRNCKKLYLDGGNDDGHILQLQARATSSSVCPKCGKPVLSGYFQGKAIFWGREPYTLERLAYRDPNTLLLDNHPSLTARYPSVRCRRCKLIVVDFSSLTPADCFADRYCRWIIRCLIPIISITGLLSAVFHKSVLPVVIVSLLGSGIVAFSYRLLRWWEGKKTC